MKKAKMMRGGTAKKAEMAKGGTAVEAKLRKPVAAKAGASFKK
jgi:hypothetical protein